jgi:superfamily II DNA or RNA helicase
VGHPVAGEPVMLRDYQVEVVNNFLENPQCVQEVATGAGKTLMTAALSASVEKYGRSIVVVPNKSLVVQTEDDYRNLGLDVGVYFGDRKEVGKTHTICTWQSLNSLLKSSKNREDRDEPASMRVLKDSKSWYTIDDFLEDVICVIIDEVHQAKADALKTLLTGPMANIPIRWGLTGTIPKEKYEFSSLHVSLGDVVNQIAASELQEKGVLAQCHVSILQTQDHKEYANYQNEMQYLVTDETRIEWLANKINDIKESGNTLVLVDRIAAGHALVEQLKDAVFVSGATKAKDRQDEYDERRHMTYERDINQRRREQSFEIGEEKETTQRGTLVITGGSRIVYAITKDGQRYAMGEKTQRSKTGPLGKLETVYKYHPDLQKCFDSQ